MKGTTKTKEQVIELVYKEVRSKDKNSIKVAFFNKDSCDNLKNITHKDIMGFLFVKREKFLRAEEKLGDLDETTVVYSNWLVSAFSVDISKRIDSLKQNLLEAERKINKALQTEINRV